MLSRSRTVLLLRQWLGLLQITGSSSLSMSRFTEMSLMPSFVSYGCIRPFSSPSIWSCAPNIFGIDGPVISASRYLPCSPSLPCLLPVRMWRMIFPLRPFRWQLLLHAWCLKIYSALRGSSVVRHYVMDNPRSLILCSFPRCYSYCFPAFLSPFPMRKQLLYFTKYICDRDYFSYPVFIYVFIVHISYDIYIM